MLKSVNRFKLKIIEIFMNEAYFRSLPIKRKNHALDHDNRWENPRPIVDYVIDEDTNIGFIVDYNNQRYKEANDSENYSDWKPFLINQGYLMNMSMQNTVLIKKELNGTFSVVEEIHFPQSGNTKTIPRFNGAEADANAYFEKLVNYRKSQFDKVLDLN